MTMNMSSHYNQPYKSINHATTQTQRQSPIFNSNDQYSFGRPSLSSNQPNNYSFNIQNSYNPVNNSTNSIPREFQSFGPKKPVVYGGQYGYNSNGGVPLRPVRQNYQANLKSVHMNYPQNQYTSHNHIHLPRHHNHQPYYHQPQQFYYNLPYYEHNPYHPAYYPTVNQIFSQNHHRPFLSGQQTINSNFNYEQANFDVNYKVQQNLVHCVLCDQTYKTTQKKQHLQKHRQKIKNINIRPVDQMQLKRLEKYNAMTKKGLIIKPIVQPEEFNIQYKPNEFVLKKINNYIDPDMPINNNIAIQTQKRNNYSGIQHLGYQNQNIRSNNASRVIQGHHAQMLNQDQRSNSGSRAIQAQLVERLSQNPRLTNNTRFNTESFRVQQDIQLGYDQNNNYQINNLVDRQSLRNDNLLHQTQRNSRMTINSKTAEQNKNFDNILGLNPRNAQSYNQAQNLGFKSSKVSGSDLHRINQQDQFMNSSQQFGYKS